MPTTDSIQHLPPHTGQETGVVSAGAARSAAEGHTPAQQGGNAQVFNQLLAHIADHHELDFEPIGTVPLPYIFWDHDGFHTFSSAEALSKTGKYSVDTNGQSTSKATYKVVRTDSQPISFDMSITSNVIFLALAAVVLITLLGRAASKAKHSLVPSGFRNLVEVLMVFIRDDIAYPNVEQPWADKLMPFFLSLFFFITLANLLGILPWGHTPTGALSVTGGLAAVTFVITQYVGLRTLGFVNFMKHFSGGVLDMELPMAIKIALMVILIPIEIMGLFTKPFALTVRLFANMTGGHVMIVTLIGLAFAFRSLAVAGFMSVPFALFISILEIFVALLQAYIFTALSAVFIGFMAHNEHEEHVNDHDLPHAPEGNKLSATAHAV
jgi:F-type H+-transporting ATPase subunit a